MAMASDYWKVVGDAFCNVLVGFTEPENEFLCSNTNTFLMEFEAVIRRVTSDEADRLLDDDVIPREIVNTTSIELDDSDSSYMEATLSETLQQLQVPLEERNFMVENVMLKASEAARNLSPCAGGKRLRMRVNIDMYVIDDDDDVAKMASLLFLQPLTNLSSSTALVFLRNPHHVPALTSLKPKPLLTFKTLTTCFSLAESDSPKSLQPETRTVLQDLADSFDLPPDYFAKLPNDLRLDLNDAAFDLSNGKIIDECGQELGETLLNLSRAWEVADTSTSHSLASKLPDLEESLTNNAKSALGKRLVSAGRRFQSMGMYGQGELQKIAKTMTTAGKLLSASPTSTMTDEEPKNESRMLKFGELQLELTSEKATIGAIISFAFGILSWQLAQGVQNIPENSLQYANDNALLLAKSLRGALLAACYSSAILSGFTTFGLILLGRQLKSPKEK